MIGRLHHIALDCRDPRAEAAFWSAVLGWPVTYDSADWVVVAANDHSSGMAFQLAPDHQPPEWPNPLKPQQIHVDVMVEDPAVAGLQVVELGATPLAPERNIYADVAGHPFCLITRPGWAPPIS